MFNALNVSRFPPEVWCDVMILIITNALRNKTHLIRPVSVDYSVSQVCKSSELKWGTMCTESQQQQTCLRSTAHVQDARVDTARGADKPGLLTYCADLNKSQPRTHQIQTVYRIKKRGEHSGALLHNSPPRCILGHSDHAMVWVIPANRQKGKLSPLSGVCTALTDCWIWLSYNNDKPWLTAKLTQWKG